MGRLDICTFRESRLYKSAIPEIKSFIPYTSKLIKDINYIHEEENFYKIEVKSLK